MNIDGMFIKVDPKLKLDFERASRAQDTTPTQALRHLMRRYVAEYVERECSRITLRVKSDGGDLFTDERTGGMFVTDEVSNIKRMYRLLDEFEHLHPDVAPLRKYQDREDMKKCGRALLQAPQASLKDRTRGYEMVMQAQFMRSAMDSLKPSEAFSYLDHPGYAEYARHYVAYDVAEGLVAGDLALELQRRHAAPDGPVMVKDACWRPDLTGRAAPLERSVAVEKRSRQQPKQPEE